MRFLSDENFNGEIVRGLLLGSPAVDLCRVQDVGLAGADDPAILEWAAENDRVLLTHDRATMPDFAYARVLAGKPMPGAFVLHARGSVREAIRELLEIDACTEQADGRGVSYICPCERLRLLPL